MIAADTTSGLAQVLAMIASGECSGMDQLMNIRVIEVTAGTAMVEALPSAKFHNTMFRMHGGFAATIIDTALGFAVMTKLPAHTGFGTIELKVNYVRRIEVETGLLTCRSSVIHAGRTMLTAEAKLADAKGVLYAHGSGTFLVYPK